MAEGILIVDDDPSILLFLKKVLKKEGYKPLICNDEEFALELLKQMEFPLVILDINLPNVNGWDILDYIHKEAKNTSVLIITGSKNDKTKKFEEKYEGDVSYMITYKPFNAKEVLDKIHTLISRNKNKQ
jgi:DNA-binding response OmpR family regulator